MWKVIWDAGTILKLGFSPTNPDNRINWDEYNPIFKTGKHDAVCNSFRESPIGIGGCSCLGRRIRYDSYKRLMDMVNLTYRLADLGETPTHWGLFRRDEESNLEIELENDGSPSIFLTEDEAKADVKKTMEYFRSIASHIDPPLIRPVIVYKIGIDKAKE